MAICRQSWRVLKKQRPRLRLKPTNTVHYWLVLSDGSLMFAVSLRGPTCFIAAPTHISIAFVSESQS